MRHRTSFLKYEFRIDILKLNNRNRPSKAITVKLDISTWIVIANTAFNSVCFVAGCALLQPSGFSQSQILYGTLSCGTQFLFPCNFVWLGENSPTSQPKVVSRQGKMLAKIRGNTERNSSIFLRVFTIRSPTIQQSYSRCQVSLNVEHKKSSKGMAAFHHVA